MAENLDSSGASSPRPVPEALAPGLDLFAAAWLQTWSEAGGDVYLENDGGALFGFPDSALTGLPWSKSELSDWQGGWHDGHYHGRMRALLDFLESVPEGANAVKAHLREHGMRYFLGAQGSCS